MESPTFPGFFHRVSKRGVKSICIRCFSTVETAQNEADLEEFEREHVCDPAMLKWFEQLRRRTSSSRY